MRVICLGSTDCHTLTSQNRVHSFVVFLTTCVVAVSESLIRTSSQTQTEARGRWDRWLVTLRRDTMREEKGGIGGVGRRRKG